MEKNIQDLAWKSAPKEFREQVKKMVSDKENYTHEQKVGIRLLYGDDNLFSDTEPEEMLTILRKDVTEEYKQATADLSRTGNLEYKGKREILKNLFGDKCRPDKEE